MPTGARTATRVRKAKVDRLDSTPGGLADEISLTGLVILPRQSYEQGRGWVTIEGKDIYILPTSRVLVGSAPPRPFADGDVLATDQLRIDGKIWQVDGPPAEYDKGVTRKATLVKVKNVGA